MRLTFNINYHTQWGENLQLLATENFDSLENAIRYPLSTDNGKDWILELNEKDFDRNTPFNYRYIIHNEENDSFTIEGGGFRSIAASQLMEHENIQINDHWRSAEDPDQVFFSSAFSEVLFPAKKRKKPKNQTKGKGAKIIFNLYEIKLNQDEVIAISGDHKILGNWQEAGLFQMDGSKAPVWKAEINLPKNVNSIEYKYVILNSKTGKVKEWESGYNRSISIDQPNKSSVICNDDKFRHNGKWKGVGVAIPVFSLKSEDSVGIGEFLDLKKIIDWAHSLEINLIQILPINDTIADHSWRDAYPYSAISVFALHPIYINLAAIGKLSSPLTQKIIEEKGVILNNEKTVQYNDVMKLKWRFLRQIFKEKKDEFAKDEEFKIFFQENKFWLKPYAAFCYLRDLYQNSDFSSWGEFSKFTEEKLEKITSPEEPHHDHVALYYFVQYHLYKQLSEVSKYAKSKKVILKGDIPIGICRNSVDAWTSPHLYHMDGQAGAPPDAFATGGQNWEFPTYNWAVMAKDNFQWWRDRLKMMEVFFKAFRMDHILGFFRIWQIPEHAVQGLLGYFNPAIPIHIEEFAHRGIPFDKDRFCKPFINDEILSSKFGREKGHIIRTFLHSYDNGFYGFRDEFNTQRRIESYFSKISEANIEKAALLEKLKFKLYELQANILFIEDLNNPNNFHPRIELQKTESFAYLDGASQWKIDQLYVDYYFKRQEEFWEEKAMIKLPALKEASNMMMCGEDLGMVPACVPGVMTKLGILGLNIQRMPKDPSRQFLNPSEADYLSVVSPSTHDMSTIRAWWEEDRGTTQQYFNAELGRHGIAPEYCDIDIATQINEQHLYSPAMWAIFPIQDLFAMEESLRVDDPKSERINDPANPENKWNYRMHITLEDLISNANFNEKLARLIRNSGR
ncbi:4-alpha-glucanotransferase [Aureibacter tunicatorum]|uniref:4-alpha-glucanotransferase n=1 Tax=Aureibacter tunicatorum TaxID=866807 RepID=A0AAE3XQE7_9BACT|nr:4-alpha-glucanotransferase [Aureibacter tunicatorum]MDR6240134.1 4-alpha-glucanotransferase [Aureibacter tunicatorum]BDD05985.1 4-alpha-glucanotransferase [Aureibacter tunicatorum]